MRVRFKPSKEQRKALRAQLARVHEPAAALEILRPMLPDDFTPSAVEVRLASAHPDRFVVRAEARSADGEAHAYALKAYSDDFVEQVWSYAQELARQHRPNHRALCLPLRHIAHERMLVFPWVDGEFLSDVLDERKPELLRQAARLAADLHRLAVVPERLTTLQMFVDETLARYGRLCVSWPEAGPLAEPLTTALVEAASLLEPADPAPVHGDMSPGQFLWTGECLALLDLDMFGYADPAYDVGHFQAQMERRAVVDPEVRALTPGWLAGFGEAYLAEMPQVSARRVAFYRGLTLIRKIYTVCRREPEWPRFVPLLAERARQAFGEVISAEERVS